MSTLKHFQQGADECVSGEGGGGRGGEKGKGGVRRFQDRYEEEESMKVMEGDGWPRISGQSMGQEGRKIDR